MILRAYIKIEPFSIIFFTSYLNTNHNNTVHKKDINKKSVIDEHDTNKDVEETDGEHSY
jgi:hypothetical protein